MVVQIGLLEGVACLKLLRLARVEGQTREVLASQRIGHRDIGQGDVARVGHHHAVVQNVPIGISKLVAIALTDIEKNLLNRQCGRDNKASVYKGVSGRRLRIGR